MHGPCHCSLLFRYKIKTLKKSKAHLLDALFLMKMSVKSATPLVDPIYV